MFLKKIRLFAWLSKAFIIKHLKLILLGLVAGLMLFFLISKLFPLLPKFKKHERIGYVGKYTKETLSEEILALLGYGLTTIGKDGSAQPGLAQSWTISKDGLVYTFTLRDNIFWQDAKKIKAEEVVYNFKDVKREVLDDKTIRFILKEPFSPFPTVLHTPIFKGNLIGSGPFKIEKVKKSGDFITMLQLAGPDKNITYRFYPTVESAKTGFKLGEVDIIDGLFIGSLGDSWKKNIKTEKTVKKDRYIGLFFNLNHSLLGSKVFRQALNYATKKQNSDLRVFSPINPDSWGYNKEVKRYDYDPEHAKKLFDKFREDEKLEVKLSISTSQAFLPLAESIKKSWQEVLGIKTEVKIINTITNDYQVFLGIQEIPPDPDQYALWHSTRPENMTGFKDPRIDKLLEDGRRILDKDKRKEKYYDFQKFLLEESPVVFLEYPEFYRVSRNPIF